MKGGAVIIGGGVIGISAAYFLARSGIAVTVIDKGEVADGSSYGNAGLLCPCHSTPLAAPGVLTQGLKWLLDPESPFYIKPSLDPDLLGWLWRFRRFCNQEAFDRAVPLLRDLQRASLQLYRQIVEQEGLACHFEQHGGLALYRTAEGFAHGREEAAQLAGFGLRVSVLDPAAALALEPAVRPDIAGALHFEEDAHITPHLFVQGLARAAERRGAKILTGTEVLGFDRTGGRVTAVRTAQGKIEAEQVVLAAGAWSARIGRELGLRLPLQPAKGYSVTLARPAALPHRYLYLGEAKVAVTPMGGQLRLAGTLELAGFNFEINRRRVNAILRAADDYLVDGQKGEIGEVWRGMRPCSPDGLPYIGRTRGVENLIVGTGHAMLGMSMGPITGQLLAEVVRGERPSHDLEPFLVDRFA